MTKWIFQRKMVTWEFYSYTLGLPPTIAVNPGAVNQTLYSLSNTSWSKSSLGEGVGEVGGVNIHERGS